MIKFCKDQWDANRERLEEALKGDTQLNNNGWREDERYNTVELEKS